LFERGDQHFQKEEKQMRLRTFGLTGIVAIFMYGSSMSGQVSPAATQSPLHLQMGAEFSGFNTDVDYHPFEYGIGAYADLRVWGPLSIEAEGRTTQFEEVDNIRQDTISGGFLYKFNLGTRFGGVLSPYGKVLAGLGSGDFQRGTYRSAPLRQHDTFPTVTTGGGLDYRIGRHLSLRGDYEYQFWLDYGRGSRGGLGVANPEGFSIGLAYVFF
jgi:opacity protein-like surface antigen